MEMNPDALQVEISPLEPPDADTISFPLDAEGEQEPFHKTTGLMKRLGNVLRVIGLGH